MLFLAKKRTTPRSAKHTRGRREIPIGLAGAAAAEHHGGANAGRGAIVAGAHAVAPGRNLVDRDASVGAQVQADVAVASQVQALAHVEDRGNARHLHAAEPLLEVLESDHLGDHEATAHLPAVVAAGVGVGQSAHARAGEVATAGALPSCLEAHAELLTFEQEPTVHAGTLHEAAQAVLRNGHGHGATETELATEAPAGVDLGDLSVDLATHLHTGALGRVDLALQAQLRGRDLLGRPGPIGLVRGRDQLLEACDLHAELGLGGLELGVTGHIARQVGAGTDDALPHRLEASKLGLGRGHPAVQALDGAVVMQGQARLHGGRLGTVTDRRRLRGRRAGVEHSDSDQDGRDHEERLLHAEHVASPGRPRAGDLVFGMRD